MRGSTWRRTPSPRGHRHGGSSNIVGLVVALLAAFTPIDVVAELTSIGTLPAFVLVSIAVLILRRTQPDLCRAFRIPLVPLLPILSAVGAIMLIFSLKPVTLVRFVVWLASGLVIYFAASRRRSQRDTPSDRSSEPGLPHDDMFPRGALPTT
jgi:amino acid transporter